MFVLPPAVILAVNTLKERRHSAYLVGGSVRDLVLGRTPADYDLATSARPEEIMEAFKGYTTIPTGLKHGTVTVIIGGMPLEITTYRVDGPYKDHRRPESVTFTDRIEEDLARRDFTVNALAYSPGGKTLDAFGGLSDMQAKKIRCVGDADTRFEEDGLRILRALRFASCLDYTLEKNTEEALWRKMHLLKGVSIERVTAELCKLVCGPAVERILLQYTACLGLVLPCLLEMRGFDQRNRHHIFDVLTHTAKVTAAVPGNLPVRLAALFHDVSKPETFTLDEKGIGHFYGHQEKGAKRTEEILTALRLDTKTIRRVVLLVEEHDKPLEPDEKQIKKLLNRITEPALRELLQLKKADVMAQNPLYRDRLFTLEAVERLLDKILRERSCFTLQSLAVGGTELLRAGIKAGPELGDILTWLLNQVIESRLPNQAPALLAAVEAETRKETPVWKQSK